MIITPYQLFQYIMWGGAALLIIIGTIMLYVYIFDNLVSIIRTRRSKFSNLEYEYKRLQAEVSRLRSIK